MRYVFVRLRNWPLGQKRSVRTDSELIQHILDAEWFNRTQAQRDEITREVEANSWVWFTPTRLGAILQFPFRLNGRKTHADVFIQLYDNRVVKVNCFRIQTYKTWFKNFLSELRED